MTFRMLLRNTGEFLMLMAQHKPGMFLRCDAPAAQTTTLTTEGNPTTVNKWLSIFNLIPVIAAGINVFHSGKPLADKQTLAQEALSLSIAGAQAVAPAEDQQLVASVGQTAQDTLTSLLAALHNTTTQPVVG